MVTSFRFRFNNHKRSLNRFSKGQRGSCGQHLYKHFFEEGRSGLNVNKPTERGRFWIEKLNTYMYHWD
jgi:hypothetical protein